MREENGSHQVILLKVLDIDVKWDCGPICTVEYKSLKTFVIVKASHVDEFIKSTNLLENHQILVRFDNNGAEIEVVTFTRNDDLFNFREKLQIVKDQLHSKFVSHRETIQESGTVTSEGQPPKSSPSTSKSIFAERESIHKLLAGPTGARIEIDFGSTKEMVESQISAPIHRQILDTDVRATLTGEIGILNEMEQKVTFCNIDGVRGLITLDISHESDRSQLVMALHDYRRIVVAFAPYKDPSRPDMQARTGKLIAVESVGDANERLL